MLAPGTYHFDPEDGRFLLDVTRDGLVRRMGHDLVLIVESWSADATVADDLPSSSLFVAADLRSLAVLAGKGGLLPLLDRDKREILSTARKVLGSDAEPELTWTSTSVKGDGQRIVAGGELKKGDRTAPLELTITTSGGSATATAELRQTALGIKPYQAFMGALRVKDLVAVTASVKLVP